MMCKLHLNAEFRSDPTRTKTLRRQFERDMNKRWDAIIRELQAFMESEGNLTANRDYEFTTGPLSTVAILDFLTAAIDEQLIDADEAERIIREKGVKPDPNNWIEGYVYTAYKKGVKRAETEYNKRVNDERKKDLMLGAIKRRNHQDKLEQVLGRTYTDLKKIDSAMEAGIRREIALGLEAGEGTEKIAKRIRDRVEKIGKTRSRTLARTEVIRAHHAANVATYREAGVGSAEIQAEFSTAGDARVCKKCEGLEGTVYSLNRIENLIPVHPNCRCIAIPIIEL